jgi:7-keto-8-aminopelargonate synthetase-like enzyme
VAKNRSRFRISISATHTHQQLDEAATILSDVMQSEGLR